MSIKYASIVPLIGGMTLAGIKATNGIKPSAIMTYSPFKDNELSLKMYLPDVPYHVLDEDGDIDAGKDFDYISKEDLDSLTKTSTMYKNGDKKDFEEYKF